MAFLKRFAFVAIMLFFVLSSWGKGENISAGDFFIQMPEEEIPYLNITIKSEMVERYNYSAPTKIRNLLGGNSWVSYMDSSRIDVVLVADKVFLTVKAFDVRCGKRIYAVVKTLYTPIADSNIKFYDEYAELIKDGKLFDLPKFENFFAKTKDKELRVVMDKISMMFLRIDISNEGNLVVSLDDMWLDVLDKDISERLLKLKYKTPIHYKWTGKRFKRVVN